MTEKLNGEYSYLTLYDFFGDIPSQQLTFNVQGYTFNYRKTSRKNTSVCSQALFAMISL